MAILFDKMKFIDIGKDNTLKEVKTQQGEKIKIHVHYVS